MPRHLSAAKPEDGDAKIPSAHGYAVAGASHALQEAVSEGRRGSGVAWHVVISERHAWPDRSKQSCS